MCRVVALLCRVVALLCCDDVMVSCCCGVCVCAPQTWFPVDGESVAVAMEATLGGGDWVTNGAYFAVVSVCAPIWEEVGAGLRRCMRGGQELHAWGAGAPQLLCPLVYIMVLAQHAPAVQNGP